MKVKLTHDTLVRFAKDTVLEVSDSEASRLIAFNNAVEVKAKAEKTEAKPVEESEKKPAKKKTTKK